MRFARSRTRNSSNGPGLVCSNPDRQSSMWRLAALLLLTLFVVPAHAIPLGVSGETIGLERAGERYRLPATVIAEDLFVRDAAGRDIAISAEAAADLYAALMQLREVVDTDLSGLQRNLLTVRRAAVTARVVNEVGDFSESGLSALGAAYAHGLTAPLTGGALAADAMAGQVADVLKQVRPDVQQARFVLGLSLVTMLLAEMEAYAALRNRLLADLESGRDLSVDSIARAHRSQRVVRELAPFAARMTLHSVARGTGAFWNDLRAAFGRVVLGAVGPGSIRLADQAERSLQTLDEVVALYREVAEVLDTVARRARAEYASGLIGLMQQQDFAAPRGAASPGQSGQSALRSEAAAYFVIGSSGATDASGRGHRVQTRGGRFEPNAPGAGAWAFSGFGQSIDTDLDLSRYPTFTLAMWIRRGGNLDDGEGVAGTVGESSFGKQGFDFAIRDDRVVMVVTRNNRSTLNLTVPAPRSRDWHHYVWVFSAGGVSRIYVDGQEVASQANSPPNPPAHQERFHFGRSYTRNNIRHHFLVGAIAEVGLWDRELSESEILRLMRKQRGRH